MARNAAREASRRLRPRLSAAIVVVDNERRNRRSRRLGRHDDHPRRGARSIMARARALAGLGAQAVHLCAWPSDEGLALHPATMMEDCPTT